MSGLQWTAPTIPYSPIDALNRRAAAVGSPGFARAASGADYNGHRISVSWNDYRRYYVTQYYWGERVVLARGDFAVCVRAAMQEYRRGALGCSVHIGARDDDETATDVASSYPELIEGDEDPCEWVTWRHGLAAKSVQDYAIPGMMRIRFDWDLMQAAEDADEYKEALQEKYGYVYC